MQGKVRHSGGRRVTSLNSGPVVQTLLCEFALWQNSLPTCARRDRILSRLRCVRRIHRLADGGRHRNSTLCGRQILLGMTLYLVYQAGKARDMAGWVTVTATCG